MIETSINLILFIMLVLTAISVVRMRRLFGVVILSGVFSLLSALLFVALDAVDVAFTEAAVGAGISTVLMLGTIALTSRIEKPDENSKLVPLVVVFLVGGGLFYGTLDMPNFGDPMAPAQVHVRPEYINNSVEQIDVPNIVTSILASYRGFDTMGEVAVVFTAGIGVLLLLARLARRRETEVLEVSDNDGETNS